MSARDIYHENVKAALVKDRWTITHDPLRLSFERKNVYVDLLDELQPARTLFLAVTHETFESIFKEPFGEFVLRKLNLKMMVFDENQEVIIKWIP